MLNVLILAAIAVLGLICLLIVRRAGRMRPGVLRWLFTAGFALGALGFAAMLAIALFGYYRLESPQNRAVPSLRIAGTPQELARGQKLANLCITCHSANNQLPLAGGDKNVVDLVPVGTLRGSNLTPAGQAAMMTDGEMVLAIREGLHKDKTLLGMPSWSFRHLSDADALALVSYLRSQPPVAHEVPRRDLNIVAALAVGAGLAPLSVQPAITQPVVAPAAGTSPEYGEYLVNVSGCRDCHGQNLNGGGGLLSPTPNGPSLRLSVRRLEDTEFVTLIRTGVRPNGRALSALMPWKDFNGAFSDDEMKAIYNYLNTLAPIVSGQ